MGKTCSKEECSDSCPEGCPPPQPSVVSTTTTNKIGEINNSSGFHLFELHLPTVGYGIIAIVILLTTVAFCICGVRKMWKYFQRRAIRQQHLLPYPPSNMYRPYPFYPVQSFDRYPMSIPLQSYPSPQPHLQRSSERNNGSGSREKGHRQDASGWDSL